MSSSIPIDWKIVRAILEERKEAIEIKKSWVNVETAAAWERHIKKYKGLPESLQKALLEIKDWLKENF